MQARLTSGPATILASGQATTFHGAPLCVSVLLDGGGVYTLELRFPMEPSTTGPVARTAVEPWGIVLELANFREVAGRGTAEPVLLGAEGDTLYFLHVRVWHTGSTQDVTVHYTVFRVMRSEVGFVDAPTALGGGT